MRMEKLGALGALGGAFAVLLVYVLIAWVALPVRTGGMDQISATVTWIACAVPAILLIALQLVMARVLWQAGSGKRFTY